MRASERDTTVITHCLECWGPLDPGEKTAAMLGALHRCCGHTYEAYFAVMGATREEVQTGFRFVS